MLAWTEARTYEYQLDKRIDIILHYFLYFLFQGKKNTFLLEDCLLLFQVYHTWHFLGGEAGINIGRASHMLVHD